MMKKLLLVMISALICCSSAEVWALSTNNTEENAFSDGSTKQEDINLFEDDVEVEFNDEMGAASENFLERNGETTDFITDEEKNEIFSEYTEYKIEDEEVFENVDKAELIMNPSYGSFDKSYEEMMQEQEELELNKYYNVVDLGQWNRAEIDRSIYYLFKANIPANGRIKIEIEDCRSNAFNWIWFDKPSVSFDSWWETGTESYDSGWVTVKPGAFQGYIINGEYCTRVNREARFIIKYERLDEYQGECEDNDTYDTATMILPNTTYEGDFSKRNDIDVYRFQTMNPGLVQIIIQNAHNTKIDATLYEEDKHGNVDEIKKFGNSTRVRLSSGNYFLKVRGIRQYSLCVNVNYESPNAYEQEPNNVKSQANDKVINAWYTGNLNTLDDVDYFKFDIDQKSYLALEFKVPRQLEPNLIKISLYDKDLNLLDTVFNTSNPYIKTEARVYNKGIYYVKVEKGKNSVEFNDDYSFCLNQKEYVNILPAVTGMKAKVIGMNKVTLNWNAVGGAEGYFIIGMNKDRKGGQIAFTAGTSWTDTAADADAFNFYWVQPYNRDETGKIVKGKLGNYVYALGRNVGNTGKVTATVVNNGVKLSWNKVSGANSYVILSKTGSNKAAFNTPMYTNKTSFIDITASSGKVTYYWVYGVYKNASGTVLAAGNISPFAWIKPE